MVTGGEGGANTDGERKREAITIMMHEPRPQPREVQPFRGARLARMLGRHIARRMGCGVGGLGGVVVWRMSGDDEDGGGCEWTLDIGHGGALDCRRRG
jgi:hypothetical protein